MTALPPGFLSRPMAHRALHGPGRPENSRAAVRAAVDAGYGIEIDVQPSSDGVAMVFHDDTLDRVTGETGPVRARTAVELGGIGLTGGDGGIPTLEEVLAEVGGRVPLVIEIKDQDGTLGPGIGGLEEATARALHGYGGPVAVMSFNPHSVVAMKALAPALPRGLTTCNFVSDYWAAVPPDVQAAHTAMERLDDSGASFISHHHLDLAADPVAGAKAKGLPVLTWTIKSEAEAREARTVADQITFEGFLPA